MKTMTIAKTAGGEAISQEQLERINLFTRRALSADEVYVFSVILCDNEVDRDGEQFTEHSLEVLGELFIGKTGVFDHNPKAENQSARIFETQLIRGGDTDPVTENSLGEPYVSLKAWAYMVRCDKNADLILEIDAGIKKEVSVGCSIEQMLCSVCGANQKTAPCNHQKGETYDGRLCYHQLVNPTDAYEWSFVAVPAQKNAGVTKKYPGQKAERCTELSKLFGRGGDVLLTQPELTHLKKQYEELSRLAEAGRLYTESLCREIVKLAALAEPAMPSETIGNIAKKLQVPELLELQRAFGKIAAKSYPVSPQLAGRSDPVAAANSQFKI